MPGKRRENDFNDLLRKHKKRDKARMPPRTIISSGGGTGTQDASHASWGPNTSSARSSGSDPRSSSPCRAPVQPPSPPVVQPRTPSPSPSPSTDHEDNREVRRRRKKLQKILKTMQVDIATRRHSASIDQYHRQARMIPRVVHLFMQPLEMLLFGQTDNPDEDALSDSDDESDSEDLGKQIARERHRANKRELRHQYKVVLDLMPNLRNDMKYLDEDDLIILSNYINFHLTNVRGDDGGSLRDRVITYLRDSRIKGFESAPSEVQKFYRGWSNMFTARMLCPQNMLARFDANPEAFCEMIISGPEGDDESILRGGNFPSFLYDQKQADPENELQGLLRSPYLLTCYKSLWTGPSSARLPGGRQNKTAGRPPIAWANNFFKVTPRTLAYTAVQVRYELTSLTIWSSSDIAGFSAYELFNEIVALFADPESDWYLDTLAWWNKQVFANAPDKSAGRAYNNRGGGPQTTAEKLRVQRRKEKKARKAMQSQAHGCAPSHPASASGSNAEGTSA